MNYIDYFNQHAGEYFLFRPNYPALLIKFLASVIEKKEWAWDCATGNGQAALMLSQFFNTVIATDINQAQLDVAPKHSSVQYVCCASEQSAILSNSIDLITVAQALHWFKFDDFYQEVRRVAIPGGMIAAWCYSLGKFHLPMDTIIKHLYSSILGDAYWPWQRTYIDENYTSIPFPFKIIPTPKFTMEKELNFKQFVGYLRTWSAVKAFQTQNKADPIQAIFKDLLKAWGNPEQTYTLYWSLHLLLGRVDN